MTALDSSNPEAEALRQRISTLSAAILRISSSLDMATVLQEVVDSARALTGARRGAIITIDGSGQLQDFVTSGFTDEEYRELSGWPDGPRLFEHLRDLPAPLRLSDFSAHARSLGFSSWLMPTKAFQGIPMRHRGVHVGNFFLAGKEGAAEFTAEDEEVLVLFASQAAAAIGNARTHRAEQRARADLEALVETSPVGVVVFDARTGSAVSLNREVRRLIEGLGSPGASPEELLKVLVCRRGDGHEFSLAEFPLAGQFSSAEAVRAEEMVFSLPDGRSIETLVNATPIHVDGMVASVVVTLQDLAQLRELERQRVEFLGMVSHELRAPLSSIKGSTTTALSASRVVDPAEARQFFRIIDEQADRMDGLICDLLDVGRIEAGTLSVDPEPSDVAVLVDQARNTFVSGGGRHDVIDRPAAGPASGDGRPSAHRPGAEQPVRERGASGSGMVPDYGRGGARGRSCRGLGLRRGPGGVTGAAAATLPQAFGVRGRRAEAWDREDRAGPRHLQGAGGGAWRTHPG